MKTKKHNKLSSTIKSRLSKSKNKSQKNIIKDDANIVLLKSFLQCKTYLELKNILIQFYNNSKINDMQFEILNNNIIPLSTKGKSGSIIGYFKSKPNEVIKLFNRSINEYDIINIDKCLKLSNIFNEIIINFLVSNLDKIIPSITKDEKNLLDNHTLELLNYGISKHGSFITIPLVGLKETTNLRELLEKNHSKLFNNISSSKKLLESYDKLMSSKIAGYFRALRVLQKYLKYVNSDVKMTNIFIRVKSLKKSNEYKYQDLEELGLITDFELIISDLEKSSISVNELSITTRARSQLKITLSRLINQGLIYDIRYSCSRILDKCTGINILDIDIVMFAIDYYAFMLRMDKDFIINMPKIYETFKDILGYELVEKIRNILEIGKYKIDTNYSFKIGNILQKICNKMA